MSDKENKVQFNLKNVYYAVMTGTIDAPAYDTPVKVPGAVTLNLDPQGSVTPFYADGVTYYTSTANNGYSGDAEFARIPDNMLDEIWGMHEDSNKVIVENAKNEPKPFALFYQIDGDKNEDYYVLYNCSGTRPAIGSTTNTDSKEPQTRSTTISATPLDDGRVMARTKSTTPKDVKDNWFKSVYGIGTSEVEATE